MNLRHRWLVFIPAGGLLLAGCLKQRFFEDPDDPGLSRFTNRTYKVTSAYVNGFPWVTDFSSLRGAAPARLDLTMAPVKDTLDIVWQGSFENNNGVAPPGLSSIRYLIISLPVAKLFSRTDFEAWNGKRFPADTTTVQVRLSDDYPNGILSYYSGPGSVYFVRIRRDQYNGVFHLSGLFEGNIGDSIRVTKGRFDYSILPEHMMIP